MAGDAACTDVDGVGAFGAWRFVWLERGIEVTEPSFEMSMIAL